MCYYNSTVGQRRPPRPVSTPPHRTHDGFRHGSAGALSSPPGLHVAQVAPPWYPVPPDGYGGIELVVALLTRGLRARGHRVTLFAAHGSEDVEVPAPEPWSEALGRRDERVRELTWAMRVVDDLSSRDDVDVVHDHVCHATLMGCAIAAKAPVVHTVHGPLDPEYTDFYSTLDSRVGLIAISEAQRRSASRLRWHATVHNAVDVSSLRVGSAPASGDPYLLAMARITPDKGQHIAVDVARQLRMRLVLAGKVDESASGEEYFRTRIEPAIDGDRVVHRTNVGGDEKADLLSGATALLAPLCWDEPFGLALVEAMASGTPVVSFPRGAAPEIVENGRTGFLVADAEAMAGAVSNIAAIDRDECARHARERFGELGMADAYVAAYERALEGSPSMHRR